MSTPEPDQLACGASVDDLIDQVADGTGEPTPHQEGCPHCQAALAEYQRLWAPINDLRAEPVDVPDSVLDQVLHQIRAATRDTNYGHLADTAAGWTRVAATVVAATARQAVEHIPGVRAALSTALVIDHTGADEPATDEPATGQPSTGEPATDEPARVSATAGVAGTSTAVHLVIAGAYDTALQAMAGIIRETAATSIRDYTGLHPARIDVTIDDIL